MPEQPRRFGLLPREQLAALSGLELLRGMMDGTLVEPPFSDVVGMRPVLVEPGRVAVEATTSERFLNPYGTIHAGWTTTLLDSAMSLSVQTLLKAGQGQTTVELKVNCIRPVLPGTGVVRAEGQVIHAGRQIVTVDARATDPAGKLLAHAVSTCMILNPA